MHEELLPDEEFAPGNPQGRKLVLKHLCCHQQGSSLPSRTQTPGRPGRPAPQGGQVLYSKANSLANQGFFFFSFLFWGSWHPALLLAIFNLYCGFLFPAAFSLTPIFPHIYFLTLPLLEVFIYFGPKFISILHKAVVTSPFIPVSDCHQKSISLKSLLKNKKPFFVLLKIAEDNSLTYRVTLFLCICRNLLWISFRLAFWSYSCLSLKSGVSVVFF